MTLDWLIAELRLRLKMLATDQEREEALRRVREGFCIHCGAVTDRCFCMRDPEYD